jgi:hypothetical protein
MYYALILNATYNNNGTAINVTNYVNGLYFGGTYRIYANSTLFGMDYNK